MPLDADAVRRGCRGADVTTARQLCRAELERFRCRRRPSRPAYRRLHARGATVRRNRQATAAPAPTSAFVNVRETAGWSDASRRCRAENGRADRRGRRTRCPTCLSSASPATASSWFMAATKQAIEAGNAAQGASRRHRAAHAPRRNFPAPRQRVSGGEGHDPLGRGLPRRLRHRRRRLCAARPVVARSARLRAGARRRQIALRHHARHFRQSRRCLPRPIFATAICAPIPATRRRCCARCSRRAIWSAPSTSRATSLSRSELCAHSRSQHRRLPPLPRSLPGRRHFAGRRSRRDRSRDLRRLRRVRRRLPDRRRRLCAAAGRCADAQAARAA